SPLVRTIIRINSRISVWLSTLRRWHVAACSAFANVDRTALPSRRNNNPADEVIDFKGTGSCPFSCLTFDSASLSLGLPNGRPSSAGSTCRGSAAVKGVYRVVEPAWVIVGSTLGLGRFCRSRQVADVARVS